MMTSTQLADADGLPGVKPRRAGDATRWIMATLSQLFAWRDALWTVKPDTLIRWHRQGFQLFWRWKSTATGRPPVPKGLRKLIREIAAANVTWGEERMANEAEPETRHSRFAPRENPLHESASASAVPSTSAAVVGLNGVVTLVPLRLQCGVSSTLL